MTAGARQLGNHTVFKRLSHLAEVLGLDVGEWLERWRAEISPGETPSIRATGDVVLITADGTCA